MKIPFEKAVELLRDAGFNVREADGKEKNCVAIYKGDVFVAATRMKTMLRYGDLRYLYGVAKRKGML